MTELAVILDIDGTLVDTNYQHALAWYMAFREHDIALPVWQIHRHVGMGGDHLVSAIAGESVEKEHGETLRSAHDVLYLATIQTVSVLPHARELIEDLKRRDHPVVLASSAQAQEADHYLDLLDARELADAWTTSDDVENTKPSPDLVKAALDKLDARQAVMIGDTPWDVQAAERLDVPTVAVLSGGFSAAELERSGARNVYGSISELRTHLTEPPFYESEVS